MDKHHTVFIPYVDSLSGACLTAADWKKSAVSMIACQLGSLLFKPGKDFFKKPVQLADFFAWHDGAVLLDLSLDFQEKKQSVSLRSPYDGSRLTLDLSELSQLLGAMNPDYLLLPEEAIALIESQNLIIPEKTKLFFNASETDSPSITDPGVYIETVCAVDLQKALSKAQHINKPLVLKSYFDMALLKAFQGLRTPLLVVTDYPMSDACQGLLYTSGGIWDLKDKASEERFSVIESGCGCQTCDQELTIAYLRHLYYNTPLLCHRFLISHNVYFVQSNLQG